jgi:hypothetical protein
MKLTPIVAAALVAGALAAPASQASAATAPTQSRTLSLSARFRGRRGGVGREAWYSSV